MDKHASNIIIVVPLYNHASTVADVLRQCLLVHTEVLLIDDGSTDLPENTLDGLDITVIKHKTNQGKGSAILTAAREAAKRGMTHIVTLDADLQHNPKDFILFKQAIEKNPDTLYVGKRDFSSPAIPNASKFGRMFSNFWHRVQTGYSIGDAQCGFRAYPLFVLENLKLVSAGFPFEVEVLVKARWAGVNIQGINISVYYPPKGKRVSHFNQLKDNARLTHLNTLLTIRSFIPVPHKKIFKTDEIGFSFFKPLKSIKLILAQKVSPATLAMSGATGVFLGALPLIAVHTMVILFVSGFFRLNKVVAVGASQFCMPPLVPFICIEAGYYLTHNGAILTDISLETFGHQGLDRIYEWFLGSLIVAPILGFFSFCVFFFIAATLSYLGKK
ncbi:MAG: DUF2062 domain-containing protein [Proteobacteria bacterium]|nr:DUF2062 domain-containing protein [Pseudomonadota bacterium]MBU4472062.1 DUF2062 domain-containing protein [Pseudomonadota bacterium]MCG2752940.1 DUF2062 domain-containing protein [Desulfobacteraceae bacterium]